MGGNITISAGQTLKFGNVITNEGHNYDPSTGIFTCASAGIYVFSQTLDSNKNNFISSRILKNGNEIGLVQAVGTNLYDASSYNSIVVSLNLGDRVWMSAYTMGNPADSLFKFGYYATFSGFLLVKS